jgi:hypothetical protein
MEAADERLNLGEQLYFSFNGRLSVRFPMKLLPKLVDGIFKILLDMIVEFTLQ